MALPITSLSFNVRRREAELIRPASPTPYELKPLSDIDDQKSFRFHIPFVLFYKSNPSMHKKNPVKVIREAIAKTLVFYYPFAGRLREGHNEKLFVECTGEGILFVEADADVSIDELADADAIQPPIPYLQDILFDVPGSSGITNCPLLLIQVTMTKCGGFIFALRLNHTMSDGIGTTQFMSTIAEIAQGAFAPSLHPVWERHILNARNPPRVTCIHHEYDEATNTNGIINSSDDMVHQSFFFRQTDISHLRKFLPHHLSRSSNLEVLTACLWKCRTIALQLNPNEKTRMILLVNIRFRDNSLLPMGYYGNGFALSAAMATAEEITSKPLGYALELVKKAKAEVTTEYMQSVANLMVIYGRPHFTAKAGTFIISDMTRVEFKNLDFGWGEPIFGGPIVDMEEAIAEFISFYVPLKNKKGENGLVIQISLPSQMMRRFTEELDKMLGDHQTRGGPRSAFIESSL